MTKFSISARIALLATTAVAATSLALPVVSAGATGTAPMPPPSTKAVPRFSPLYMAYQDSATVNQAMALSMAANYDVIAALNLQLQPYVAQMKVINPKLRIVGYVNGLYSPPNSTYPESWFEHDATGKRIYTFQFGGDLMDPSSAGWRQNVLSTCQTSMARSGYDGCFLDNLGQAPFNTNYVTAEPVNAATGTTWTRNGWTAAASGLTQSVVNGVPGATVMANGLGNGTLYFNPDGPTSPLLNATSAAMSEIFLRAPDTGITKFQPENAWKQNVDMIADADAAGHPVLATTKVWLSAAAASPAQIEVWHKYALASFLLGANGTSYFNFSGAQTLAALSSGNSEDNVDPGTPVGPYAKVGGGYQRTFSKGLALVNPTTVAVTVPLAGAYTSLNGSLTGGSITLAPNTGDVLVAVNTAGGVPVTAMDAPTGGPGTETLRGAVNPSGAATTFSIDYGPTSDYGMSSTPMVLPASFGQQPVSATLSGLAPGTTYHYSINATNTNGSAATQDATFTTPPLSPTVSSGPVGTVTATTADFTATIDSGNGATTWAVQYGPTMKYGSSSLVQHLAADTSPAAVALTVAGLTPVTGYHARLMVSNSAGTVYGPDRTFKTMPVVPTTTTNAATRITAISATLNGSVNPGGGSTSYHFQYGPTTSYGSTTPNHSAGSGKLPVSVSDGISHLLGNGTYHARLVSTNASGTTNGADITFTTANLAPALTSPAATSITATGARITAMLDPAGQTTTYTVEYGTTSSYGLTSAASTLAATSSPRTIGVGLGHLAKNTTYHYRVTATNGGGTTSTTDRVFTTLS